MNFDRDMLLASPLSETLDFLEQRNLDYKLVQVKPPNKKNNDETGPGIKRVIDIREKDNFLKIIWSFQYNE